MAEIYESKSLKQIVVEIKDELRGFVTTRIEMFKAELQDKVRHVKTALPMLIAAIVVAWAAFLALTFGLIALLAVAIGGDFAWAIGAGIVFGVYLIIAGLLGWIGYKEITTEGLAPERTIRVLKQDQLWIQNEARSA